MDGLLELLSNDIVLYADGGGKSRAVPNPIYGAWNVVRFLMGARRKLMPGELVRRCEEINGSPAIMSYLHGRPYGVVSFHVVDGQIRDIYVVSNPDKLAGMPFAS